MHSAADLGLTKLIISKSVTRCHTEAILKAVKSHGGLSFTALKSAF